MLKRDLFLPPSWFTLLNSAFIIPQGECEETAKATSYLVWHCSVDLIDPASLSNWVGTEGGINPFLQIPQTGIFISIRQ